jgi:hypothetical protein
MYILVISYSAEDTHVVYFNSKKETKKKYKRFKKEYKNTGSWVILAKVLAESED